MARKNQSGARERAREAKRRLDADRHARDVKIEEAATRYYEGQDLIDQGSAKVDAAVLVLLDDLGEKPENVAVLLGVETREVTAMRKRAKLSVSHEPTPASAPDTGSKSEHQSHDDHGLES